LNNNIQFTCELRSVKSCADHTFNIVLNIPEYHKEQAKALMDLIGDMVAVAMVSVDGEDETYTPP
jgi:hypothetical protein